MRLFLSGLFIFWSTESLHRQQPGLYTVSLIKGACMLPTVYIYTTVVSRPLPGKHPSGRFKGFLGFHGTLVWAATSTKKY
jgi:hypothetical protein